MMKLNIKAPGAKFGPKWAWYWALWLVPDAVKLPINVWMLSALTTLHPKGLDASIREIMESMVDAKIVAFKVTRETGNGTETYEETTDSDPDNSHTKGDF